MTEGSQLTSQLSIKRNNLEVQRDVMVKLAETKVDQSSLLPNMFIMKFNDPDLELLDNGPFNLTDEIEISAETQDGESISLIKGEITALEPSFGEDMVASLVVRGYDKSHRLYRERKSQAYLNTKDSDLANQIAQGAGLQTQVDTTSTVYDHIFRYNQTDLEFLHERARRIGYECFVAEEKLYFRQPPTGGQSLTLTWGDDLRTFHPSMTLAEQVDEVVVKGWDIDRQEAIVGRSQNGNLYPSIGESQNGSQWASTFGTGKKVIVDVPVVDQAEADTLAAAYMDDLSGAFIRAQGAAFRRPDIKAGRMVQLEGLGNRFSGTYLVTSATHHYAPSGLQTTFNVSGARTGTISELFTEPSRPERLPGVVTAVVTNTDDPQSWGRVKVQFPWLSDDAESNWARVMGIGAGPDAGLFVIPEVGDEVLVAFLHGDFNYPVVIGGVWNGQNAIPPKGAEASSNEKPLIRTWASRNGHHITVYDTNSDEKIEIETAGGHNLTLDDTNSKITITSSGGASIVLDDNASKITIESSNEVEIKSSGNMKIEAGGNLDMSASGQMNLSGAVINLN